MHQLYAVVATIGIERLEVLAVELDGTAGEPFVLPVDQEGFDGMAQRRRAGIFQNPLVTVKSGVHQRMTFLNAPK